VTYILCHVSIFYMMMCNSLCHNGVLKRISTDEALEGEIVTVRINLVLVRIIVCLTICPFLHLPFQLPPKLVVRTVMQELTAIC